MAEYAPICRICLSFNVRLLPIADNLQLVYEKISSTPLLTEDQRPVTACYICYAQLNRCYKLMLRSAKAEEVLTALLARNSKLSKRSVSLIDRKAKGLTGSLVVTPLQCLDSLPINTVPQPGNVQIKTEILENVEHGFDFDASDNFPQSLQMNCTMANKDNDSDDIKPLKCKSMNVKAEVEIYEDVASAEETWDPEQSVQFGTLLLTEENSTNLIKSKPLNQEQPQCRISTLTGEKTYECNVCKYKSSQLHNFKTHLKIHTGDKPFECSDCHRRFTHMHSLKIHLRTHSGEKPYICKFCQRCFSCKVNLTVHLRTHTGDKPYQCQICQSQFSRIDHLKRHLDTHSTTGKRHECQICRIKLSRKCHLQNHMKTHTGEKPFECNVCKHRFSDKYKMKTHLRTHTGEKPFECNVCHCRYKQKIGIKNHLIVNNGEELYKCRICRKKFHHILKDRSKICNKCRKR